MSTTRALFAGPAARRALVDGHAGAVALVLNVGIYLRLGRNWLMLADPSAPFGPLSLAVHRLERLELAPELPVRVIGNWLVLGEQAVSFERIRERQTAPLASRHAGEDAMTMAAAAALAALPNPPPSLERGIAALAVGRVHEAVSALAGRGEGLTPAGDDVLTGYAAWLAALGATDRAENAALDAAAPLSALASERSSALGLAYLRCAERGELPDAGAQLLLAIRSGSVPAVSTALPQLRAWGASSGIALAWGMVSAVKGSMPHGATTDEWDSDGLPATNRKEPDKVESGPAGKVPIDRLAEIGCSCASCFARMRRL